MALVPAYRFQFNVEFIVLGITAFMGFTRVSGIGGGIDLIEIPELTKMDSVNKFPGRTIYRPVKLERGLDADNLLFSWWNSIATEGNKSKGPPPHYKTEVRIFPSNANNRAWEIRLTNAWPRSYVMSELDASSGNFLFQSVELVHDGLTVGPFAKNK